MIRTNVNSTRAEPSTASRPGPARSRRAQGPRRRDVLDGLHRLYRLTDVTAFPGELMAVAEELIPCRNISFDSVNLSTGAATNVFDRPIPLPPRQFGELWQTFCHEHPGITYLKQGGTANVFALTDFISQRELRRTGFYQEFFHPWAESTHQLGVIIPMPGYVAGMALNRDGDFSPAERGLMEELHPHFALAFQHVQIISAAQGIPEADFTAWRRSGLTRREGEVLRWVVEGKRNAEIAIILQMKARTVGKHLENIFLKLGVETRSAAAAEATRLARTAVSAPAWLRPSPPRQAVKARARSV